MIWLSVNFDRFIVESPVSEKILLLFAPLLRGDYPQSVFYDEFAVQFFDEDNSVSEERFLMLGFSDEARLLIVCHCECDQGNIIRIISARKAAKNESNYYQGVRQ